MANGNDFPKWDDQPEHIKQMFGAHGGQAQWEAERNELLGPPSLPDPWGPDTPGFALDLQGGVHWDAPPEGSRRDSQGGIHWDAPATVPLEAPSGAIANVPGQAFGHMVNMLNQKTPLSDRNWSQVHPQDISTAYQNLLHATGGSQPARQTSVSPMGWQQSTSSAPVVPAVADWQTTATQPWRDTVQFTPGGAVYKLPRGWDAAKAQANQDYLIREGYYLNPEQFGQHMGIDIYEPGYVPGSYSPTGGVSEQFDPVAWRAVDQYPTQRAFHDHVYAEQTRRQQQAILDQLTEDFYGGGGGGGVYGRGGASSSSPYYQQSYSSYAPPVVELPAGYGQEGVVTEGEPSFSPDPNLSDHLLDLPNVGMSVLPVDARNRLNTWLLELGYNNVGVMGDYGQTGYTRPQGFEGALQFSKTDYEKLTDPTIRSWIEWLMGEMGYSAQTIYPGAAA